MNWADALEALKAGNGVTREGSGTILRLVDGPVEGEGTSVGFNKHIETFDGENWVPKQHMPAGHDTDTDGEPVERKVKTGDLEATDWKEA